jgi:hypothetical protein
MTERAELHDQLVVFLQQEHRGGFLLADPLTVCTLGFWEHLAGFIAAQECPHCHKLTTQIADLKRQIAHCQRWLRWCTRFRGGRRHGS